MAKSAQKICIAVITGVHGVKGQVRLRAFTAEAKSVATYGPLTDQSGKQSFTLTVKGTLKDQLLVALSGVATRDQAESLKGTELFIERDKLPTLKKKHEYYHADLIGLAAETVDGDVIGEVSAMHDFGAGPILEVMSKRGASVLLPFSKTVVPKVDVNAGRLVINPPDGWMEAQPREAKS